MKTLLHCICAAFCLVACSSAYGQIVVTDWFLTTGIQNLAPGGGQQGAFFETVQNPFHDSHSATFGPGTATTAYDFAWSDDSGSFQIVGSHVTPDLGGSLYRSVSTGSIFFVTTTPLIAHLTGSYSYFMPVGGMDIGVTYSISNPAFTTNYIQIAGQADTLVSPAPAGGTFQWDRTGLIPANQPCILRYDIQVRASGNSGALANGSGSFNLTFQPIPEPATLVIFTVGVTLVRRNPCRSGGRLRASWRRFVSIPEALSTCANAPTHIDSTIVA